MKNKLSTVILIQALIIVILFWVLIFYGKDEYEAFTQETDEEIESASRVNSEDGKTVIEVNQATQIQSDIRTSPVQITTYSDNILSYGNVVSIAELVQLRGSFIAAQSEAMLVNNALNANTQHYERLYALNQDDKNVSDNAVTVALNTVNSDKAKLTAIQSNIRNIEDSIRQQWGNTITALATSKPPAPLLNQLIQNQVKLIKLTLPFNARTPSKQSILTIAPTAALNKTVRAHFLSAAPTSNLTMQGKTYFYYAKADFLRADMAVKVLDFNQLDNPLKGVFIPNSAVVWYAGRPWVYQKTDASAFVRIPIDNDFEIEDGWFYQGSLMAEDEIVTNGAQLLLSEEFKYQITNENDD